MCIFFFTLFLLIKHLQFLLYIQHTFHSPKMFILNWNDGHVHLNIVKKVITVKTDYVKYNNQEIAVKINPSYKKWINFCRT